MIERLNAEFAKAVDSPKAKEIFAANAAEAMKTTPEAHAALPGAGRQDVGGGGEGDRGQASVTDTA